MVCKIGLSLLAVCAIVPVPMMLSSCEDKSVQAIAIGAALFVLLVIGVVLTPEKPRP